MKRSLFLGVIFFCNLFIRNAYPDLNNKKAFVIHKERQELFDKKFEKSFYQFKNSCIKKTREQDPEIGEWLLNTLEMPPCNSVTFFEPSLLQKFLLLLKACILYENNYESYKEDFVIYQALNNDVWKKFLDSQAGHNDSTLFWEDLIEAEVYTFDESALGSWYQGLKPKEKFYLNNALYRISKEWVVQNFYQDYKKKHNSWKHWASNNKFNIFMVAPGIPLMLCMLITRDAFARAYFKSIVLTMSTQPTLVKLLFLTSVIFYSLWALAVTVFGTAYQAGAPGHILTNKIKNYFSPSYCRLEEFYDRLKKILARKNVQSNIVKTT